MALEAWRNIGEGPRGWVRRVAQAMAQVAQPGDVIALVGGLGAGKTFFARSFGFGLRVFAPRNVCSPTFTVTTQHPGPLPLHHADLYRLENPRELDDIGLFALATEAVLLIEWADRFPDEMPDDTLWLMLERATPLRRRLLSRTTGPRGERLVTAATNVPSRVRLSRSV